MDMFLIVLVLMIVIGLSNIINHFIPFIPVPLIQIALGAILVELPLGVHITLEPELFFVLFIAPLLFNDGKKVPRAVLWKLRAPILFLALGLVFITVFVVGYLINWMIPSIPLPAAFALAAILSPTDVVAVGAMASRLKLPKNIMHLLEGEGLMNDASGLVAFKFAVAATVTGVFSLANASISFLVIAIGGFVGGALIAYLFIRLRVFLRRLGMEDVTVHMLIKILTPFIIFLITEHFHLSGILAVVAGGIVHAVERDREESPTLKLQIVSTSTWSVILYILNGLVFVLLGLQIPIVAKSIFQDPIFNNGEAITYIFVITFALLALRFTWISVAWWSVWKMKKVSIGEPSFRDIIITTVSGVRGAVTLAGAFSIPFVLADGSPFPERALIIFIAAGVILLTLLVASIFLPIVTREKERSLENDRQTKEKAAFIKTQEAAVRGVESVITDENREAALTIIGEYNTMMTRLNYEDRPKDTTELREQEKKLRKMAIEAEKRLIQKLIKEQKVDRIAAYYSQEQIERMEIAVTNRFKHRMVVLSILLKRLFLKVYRMFTPSNAKRRRGQAQLKKIRVLKIRTAKAAIRVLKENITEETKEISLMIIGEYNRRIRRLRRENDAIVSKDRANQERDLHLKAVQAERDEVQDLFEQGEITRELAQKIRKQINLREAFVIEIEDNSKHS